MARAVFVLLTFFCGKSQHEVQADCRSSRQHISATNASIYGTAFAKEIKRSCSHRERSALPTPHIRILDDYVITAGRRKCWRWRSATLQASRNGDTSNGVEVRQKQHSAGEIPTGSGKTLLAETLARLLDIAVHYGGCGHADRSGVTTGKAIDIIQKLLQKCILTCKKRGDEVVYIDEIDEFRVKSDMRMRPLPAMFSGEGVQQALL